MKEEQGAISEEILGVCWKQNNAGMPFHGN